MAGTLPLPSTLPARSAERVSARSLSIPWYIWCNLLAVACGVVGGVWDIILARKRRPRHFLDSRSHPDPALWHSFRPRLRLSHSLHHFPQGFPASRQFRFHVGIPRPARRVSLRLGRRRDDYFRALRQLVA